MYYQLILLVMSFIDILNNFNQQELSSDDYLKTRTLNSFEYLSLPKITLESSSMLHKSSKTRIKLYIIFSSAYFMKKTIDEFEKDQLGMEKDSPMIKEENSDMSIFFKTVLPNSNIALISMNNK